MTTETIITIGHSLFVLVLFWILTKNRGGKKVKESKR